MGGQMFGTQENSSTGKAFRFFKERRAFLHLVDLTVTECVTIR